MDSTTMRLSVKEIVGRNALTLEDGDLLHEQIVPSLKGDSYKILLLDFAGVSVVSTAFLNVAIGQLYGEFSADQLNSKLRIENLNEGAQSSLQRVLEHARRFYGVS